MNVTSILTKHYENDNTFRLPENKPKQTQLVAAKPLAKPDQTQPVAAKPLAKPDQTQYDWNPAPRPGTNARFDTGLIPPLKESEAGQLQIGTKRGKM